MKNVGAVDHIERIAHIVIGDQDTDAAVLEMLDQVADFAHRDGIDAGEGFVQQDVGRMRRQAARDFHAAALAARQRHGRRVADMGDAEFRQQRFHHGFQPGAIGLQQFGGGADILFGGQAAEDRGFLRQVADAQPRAAIHRQLGHVMAVHFDRAGVGGDQAGDHVEAGGLAGAVGTKQAHRLAAL